MAEFNSITFNDVSFRFNGKPLLNNFSFRANYGEHTVLKGESGSGKSTILKLLMGFLNPSSGSILLDGKSYKPQTIRQKIAWLPQDLNLGSGIVRDVIAKPFQFDRNKSQRKSHKTLEEVLQKLGMTPDVLSNQFRDLSTGQRQRVGLAICYLLDKPLVLLDEPTASLDKGSKQKAADLLLQNRKTVISTSHDPFWVDLADKIIDIS
jgi:ABC-type bacteriocin/lantibiotic exporter with double-glycine peptidase domain